MSFDRSLLPEPQGYFENQGLVLKGSSNSKWKTTSCTFHGGSDSMRVLIGSGGWICMNCGESGGDVLAYEMKANGKKFIDAAKDLGCWKDDGRMQPPLNSLSISARQALTIITFESTLVAIEAERVANGAKLTRDDICRLILSANRISRIAEKFI